MPCSTTSGLPMLGCCGPSNLGIVSVWVSQAFWNLGLGNWTTPDNIAGILASAYSFLVNTDYPAPIENHHVIDFYTVDPGTTEFYAGLSNYDCGIVPQQQGFRWAGFSTYFYYLNPQVGYIVNFTFRKSRIVIPSQVGACIQFGDLSSIDLYGSCTNDSANDVFADSMNEGRVGSSFELLPTYTFKDIGQAFEITSHYKVKIQTSPYGDETIPAPCISAP